MDNNNQNIRISETTGRDANSQLLLFVGSVLANWYWFGLSVIVCLMLAITYLRYKTPIYNITAQILVKDDKGGNELSSKGDLIDLNQVLGGVSSVDNEVMILKTRYLMHQVVKELNSNISYFQEGRLRDIELVESPFVLNAINIDEIKAPVVFKVRLVDRNRIRISNGTINKIVDFDRPVILEGVGKVKIEKNPGIIFTPNNYLCELAPIESKIATYRSNLQVAVSNKQVSIIDISFKYPIRKKGEQILKTLIKKYVEGNLNDKNVIADSTIAFIENRLNYVSEELGTIEGNIQRFRQDSRITDIDAQSKLMLENSSQYVDELSKVETKLTILNSLNEYLIDNYNNKRVLPSAVVPDDMVFNALIERYNNLLLERDRQSLSSTESNPFIQNLDQQISNLRSDMLSNLASTKRSLIITRNELRKRTGSLEGEIRRVPASQRTFLDMARQQQIKQELYIFLLQKREEIGISKTSNISNSKVIDPPNSGNTPISPNRSAILLLGVLAGLSIPLISMYLRSILNTRISTKAEIVALSSIPIIAEIGSNTEQETIVINKESRTPISEQFRSLRTNLGFFLKTDEKSILLTSSMSGEGKSFIAINMATVLALSGKKVVVMEMDLRKPNLSNKLDINNTFGFTNYVVSEEINPADVVTASGINENLFLISSGPLPPNPAETILDKRMGDLMTYLKKEFDYVIVDAPPIGLVTDAQLLSNFTDLTLYVVRNGYTHKNQLSIPNDIYLNSRMKRIALLINDIKGSNSYGYGYGYGYGYTYGAYLNNEIKSKSFFERISRRLKSRF